MLFPRQKVLIGLLFLVMPIVVALAFVETPVVSGIALEFALKIARFRTGLRLETRAWSVDTFSFSASLEDVTVGTDKLELNAKRASIQVSPLSLFFGRVHFREILIEEPVFHGELPRRWFESNEKDEKKDLPDDLPTWIGERIDATIEHVKKRKINFDRLRVRGARSELKDFELTEGDLEFSNLDGGQVRGEWSLKGFRAPGRLEPVDSFSGAISVLRERKKQFFIGFRDLQLEISPFLKVSADGRWPGEMQGTLEADGKGIVGWMKRGAWVAAKAPSFPLTGSFSTKFRGVLKRDKLGSISGSLQTKAFAIDGYLPNDIKAEFRHAGDQTDITDLRLVLPRTLADGKSAPGYVHVGKIHVEGKNIQGLAQFSNANLCGVLLAASVPDCYVDLPINGQAAFEGTVDPLVIRAKPELQAVSAAVKTSPIAKPADIDESLLVLNDAKLRGEVQIMEKDLKLVGVKIEWPDGSSIRTDGRIAYIPTVVDLRAKAEGAHLQQMLRHFLELRTQGSAKVEAHIVYDEQFSSKLRTKVQGTLTVEDFGLEGQTFGALSGPVEYQREELKLGPLKLTNGGGRALVNGVLRPTPEGSRLTIKGSLDRLEVDARAPQSGSSLFHGFVTGEVSLDGLTDFNKNPDAFIQGPMDLEVDTLTAFGVPFQKAVGVAVYRKGVLDVRQFRAKKGSGTVELSGKLYPDKGTELKFKSDTISLRNLGWDPGLDLLQEGTFRIDDGWWSPAKGWKLHGELAQLKIAGRRLPNGSLDLSGDDRSLRVAARLQELIQLDMDNDLASSRWRHVRAEVKDDGFYALFAWLKRWNAENPVSTKGKLTLDWSPAAGSIALDNFQVTGPSGSSAIPTQLLKIDGLKRLTWENGRIKENSISFDGPSRIKVRGEAGAAEAEVDADLPVALLDLLVPTFRFRQGRLKLGGVLPMPPHLLTIRAAGHASEAVFTVPGLGQPVTRAEVDLELNEGRLGINRAHGQFGNGEVYANGLYRLDSEKAGLYLDANLNRAQLVVLDDVLLDATGDISIKGEQPPYLMSGRVFVTNALYTKEFGRSELAESLSAEPSLRFALDVEIGSNSRVRNNVCLATVAGKLFLSGTDLAPDISGNIDIVSGSVFANKTEFRLTQGKVNFPGGGTKVPVVNILATTTKQAAVGSDLRSTQEYRIQLQARGPADRMSLELSSDPALPQGDIVNLLAFGVLRPQKDSQLSNSRGAVSAEAFQALFGDVLGSDINKTTGFQVRLEATQDLAQRGESVPKVRVGRRINEKMTATFGRSLDFSRPETNVQVDYNLLKNLNLTGVWESKSPQDLQGNPNGDQESSAGVDLRFKFDLK